MDKRVFVLAFIGIVIFFSFLMINSGVKSNKVCFERKCFYVETANTPEERATGLMFRKDLDKDKGMLFIFEEPGKYGFWMKNTLIPLDIIWINSEGIVVFIKSNAIPCGVGVCDSIYPKEIASYVLELNSGEVDNQNIRVGDKALFK